MKQSSRHERIKRERRHARVRAKVAGTATRPRVAVYRSLTQMHAQLIDDVTGTTLASITTAGLSGDTGERTGKVAQAFLGGKKLAELAKEKKIISVVFDRGGFRYHGRVRAFAEGAREGGLEF